MCSQAGTLGMRSESGHCSRRLDGAMLAGAFHISNTSRVVPNGLLAPEI